MNTYFGNIYEPDASVVSPIDRFAAFQTQLRQTVVDATRISATNITTETGIVDAATELLVLQNKRKALGALVLTASAEVAELPLDEERDLRYEYHARLQASRDKLELPLGSLEHQLYDADIAANLERLEDLRDFTL